MTTQERARELLDLGFSVIPTHQDKTPAVAWKPYQTKQATEDIFGEAEALAVVCGFGGVECYDFDNHVGTAEANVRLFWGANKGVGRLRDKVLFQRTQSGGYHLWLRHPEGVEVEGNRVLARDGEVTTLETRGEGGYALIDPSKGYKVLSGSWDMPRLTPEEFNVIGAASRFLGGNWRKIKQKREAKEALAGALAGEGELPGAQYNALPDVRSRVIGLLVGLGWRVRGDSGRVCYLTRPGKDKGVSATVDEMGTFYCFTSNGGAFEQRTSYTPFHVFSEIRFNGSYTEAARALVNQGTVKGALSGMVYSPPKKTVEKPTALPASMSFDALMDLKIKPPTRYVEPFLPTGAQLLFASPKHGKSILSINLAFSVATGSNALGLFHTKRVPTALIWLDDPDISNLRTPLQNLSRHTLCRPDDLRLYTEWPVIGQGCEEQLHRLADDGVRFVVMDAWKQLREDKPHGMSVYDYDYQTKRINDVAHERDMCILLIHHTRKGMETGDPFDMISGSRGLMAGCTGGIGLVKHIDKEGHSTGRGGLYTRGRNVPESYYPLTFDNELITWVHSNSERAQSIRD